MKRLCCFLVTILIANLLLAQPENYKTAMDHFQLHYNAEQYDDIFNSFSAEMKQALPQESTRQFLTGLKGQAGKIENKAFIGFQQGTYATYKTDFEKAVLAVHLSLDDNNLINGLFIQPYEEPEKTAHTAVNALKAYPKEIAEVLFSKTEDFPNHTQVAVAIIQNDRPHYYGMIKMNDTVKPIQNQNKVFEIGSVTKVFTSTVLASLVEDGAIDLTDDINSYYPFSFKDHTRLNFKNLANHTSGLPRLPENIDLSDETNPYKNYGKSELDQYLQDILELENEPSKTYVYSNLGAGLLGYTLGLSQKTNFQQLLQEKVFNKYKMKNTYTSSQNLKAQLVKGQNPEGETTANWDFEALFGAGGILSTAEDLAQFAVAQFNPANTELSLTREATFTINENMKIGLGWHILKSESGEDLVWHNGGTGGYSSSVAVNVNNRTAVVILSNLSAFHPKMGNIDKLCLELINRVDTHSEYEK